MGGFRPPGPGAARVPRAHWDRGALVVVGMVANGFTIADPEDPGMLDIVGFDTATPAVVTGFAAGAL